MPPSLALGHLTVFPERLIYQVSWAGIPMGKASLEVPEIVLFAGRPAYHIISRATSNSFADTFYKVRDINESWFDSKRLCSLGYDKKLREGRFYRDEWVIYDQRNRRFLDKTLSRNGDFSYHGGTIPAHVQDILSSLYYLREQKITPGHDIILDVNTKKNWPLVIHAVGRKTVTTPAGTFHTILIEPAIRKEGIFIQKGRKLKIWLTDDSRKIPVLMRVDLFFGHVEASLESFSS
ncbi:MAG: DUF3108 domain-containing protein [Elusimicrobiota bacterium]